MRDNQGLFGRRDIYVLLVFVLIAGLAAVAAYIVTEPEPGEPTGTPVARISPSPTSSPVPLATTPPVATLTHTPIVTPTATPCTPPEGWVPYVVQPGESLYRIALRYNLTPEDLVAANCLASADEIQAAQQILVPYPLTPTPTPCSPPAGWVLYTIQPGENMFRIALRYGMTAEQLGQGNCMASTDALQAESSIYVPYLIAPTAPPLPVGGGGGQVEPEGGPAPVTGLLDELFFATGGGGDAPQCEEPGPDVALPAILALDRVLDMGRVCVYGLLEGELGTLELVAPDGRLMGSTVFTVSAPITQVTWAAIDLWWPVGLAPGPWGATARTASNTVQGSFQIPPFEERALSVVPSAGINPLEYRNCDFYPPGAILSAFGTNHPPDRSLPLAVYRVTERIVDGSVVLVGSFVRSQDVLTDNQGDFSAVLRIDEDDPSGAYYVIPVLDTARQDYEDDLIDGRIACYQVP